MSASSSAHHRVRGEGLTAGLFTSSVGHEAPDEGGQELSMCIDGHACGCKGGQEAGERPRRQ